MYLHLGSFLHTGVRRSLLSSRRQGPLDEAHQGQQPAAGHGIHGQTEEGLGTSAGILEVWYMGISEWEHLYKSF